MMIHAPSKRRLVQAAAVSDYTDGGADVVLATSISNGEDLAPIVRHAFESGKPDALLHQLRNIARKKEVEIEELCKLHYQDFIIAVDELRGVLVDAEELKGLLSAENARLQQVASTLLLRLEELLQLSLIKKNVSEALVTLKVCFRVSKLCDACNAHIADRRYYLAVKILDQIEREYLHNTPIRPFRRVIERQIPAIKLHIEKKVCSEFNDWLVHIRSSSKEIGQLAIGHNAAARQWIDERRSRRGDSEASSPGGGGEAVYTLEIGTPEDDAMLEFDLTPVYRAHHVHTCLRIEDKFREYYYKNRLMQLNLDLQISSVQPFIESHQPFFWQITGFFIVEDRVLRTAGELLTEGQVETLWETATTKMTSVLDREFSRVDSVSNIVVIKDFVTLLCSTLNRHGYRVAPLMEALDRSRDKYHELLLSDCRKRMADILATDSFQQMTIKGESDYESEIVAFHLQTTDGTPDFPFIAPFSSSVPEACRIVRSFITDSIRYLSYGGHPHFYDIVKKYLDKLIIRVLNAAMLDLIHTGNLGASQVMQVSANIAALEQTCDLFLVQGAQLCSVPLRLIERPNAGLAAKAVLRASQDNAFNALQTLIDSKMDEYLAQIHSINWVSEETTEEANDYVHELSAYLEFLFSTAQHVLPPEELYRIGIVAMTHANDYIVGAFLSDNLKRIALGGVMGIGNDLMVLEAFADDTFLTAGLGDLKQETSLKDCLLEARQLVNLLLSSQPENFLNPVIRERNYGTLDYKKVATVCEKFKDAPDRLFGGLGGRNTKQDARKKSMEMLKKRLKDYS